MNQQILENIRQQFTMTLNDEDRQIPVNLRMENAKSTLNEIPLLFQNALWRRF